MTAAISLFLVLFVLKVHAQGADNQCDSDIESLTNEINSCADHLSQACEDRCPVQYLPLPQSCDEIRERSPSSPAGFYQIGDSTGTKVTTVYCFGGLASCDEILTNFPDSASGYYNIGREGNIHNVYCDMDGICNQGGGWTRLAYLNMRNINEDCPPEFPKLYEEGDVKACGRIIGGCVSKIFESFDVSYTEVCGLVEGYQFYTTDALQANTGNIDSTYIDGISITRGDPRIHIFTLISGLHEQNNYPAWTCPCNIDIDLNVPDFVGDDYYCESGNSGDDWPVVMHADDPLWDGNDCPGKEAPCCDLNPLQPYFYKVFPTATSDYIEFRICSDEASVNEDISCGLL